MTQDNFDLIAEIVIGRTLDAGGGATVANYTQLQLVNQQSTSVFFRLVVKPVRYLHYYNALMRLRCLNFG